MSYERLSSDFNPRTREGCDILGTGQMLRFSIFQSTHPRRVRQAETEDFKNAIVISIHAPAKGATFILLVFICKFIISIHAPAKGATYQLTKQPIPYQFQSTHPRRVRQALYGYMLAELKFQSTHPRRVRQSYQSFTETTGKFQSTHPRRVRQIQ